jgi:C1A family cysteine protease
MGWVPDLPDFRDFFLGHENITQTHKEVTKYFEKKNMFGFTVYGSISQASMSGEIPFPCNQDRRGDGHAIVATGFDDNKEITNTTCGKKTKGAIRIRNSWSRAWGDGGYGCLSYDYILNDLALDSWSLLRNEWIDLPVFEI